MRLGDLDDLQKNFELWLRVGEDYNEAERNMLKAVIHEVKTVPTVDAVPVVRCKDCEYYCIKDHWGDFNGIPVLAASNVPTCCKWANTECMVDPEGYCFLAEKMDKEKMNE